VALVHGGPGAPGEMALLARKLAPFYGVLEPLQTADSLKGQLEELATLLQRNAGLPAVLVGFSWGAMLATVLTARRPELVARLILVSSPPFEDKYVASIMETRLKRLSAGEREEALSLTRALKDPALSGKDGLFARLGKLLAAADSYDPVEADDDVLEYQYDIYKKVWSEAAELRRKALMNMVAGIECPVMAIHGDYDSHPAEGVREPLSRVIGDFRFVLLKNCGHYPWRERLARDRFLEILKKEVRTGRQR